MIASGAKKYPFLQNFALLRPKRVLGAFCGLERKNGEESISGDFWLQKRAQNLMFSTVWRSARKRLNFAKKLFFGEEKTAKRFLLARHKNMKSCEKMKKVIFNHFRQKRKTLVKRNVLGTFFRPESQKRDFSTFGSKK